MTSLVAVSNVSVKSREEVATKHEIEQIGKELLHQQLYVIGRDIVSKHGNLLLKYGCSRMQSPIPGIPSVYSTSLGQSTCLVMRGFGVFVGDDSIGGIFVHRYTFEPRWMPSSRFAPMAWVPGEMPRTRRSRYRAERVLATSLMKRMIAWFVEYEHWIDEMLGAHFRIGQLSHFPGRNERPVFWNLQKSWGEVYEQW